MRIRTPYRALSILLLVVPLCGKADVTLPRLIGDGAIVQRNSEIDVWGWADAGEKVAVDFRGKTHRTRADDAGEWTVTLPPMPAGGPYILKVSGNNTLIVENILVGDVWLASGQSNMELTMKRVQPVYGKEIQSAEYPRIRHFDVPDRFNFKHPENNLEGGQWQATTPDNILDFSAVAWFFARELNAEYDVPVGIVNASLGGSPAQAWLSETTLKKFPEYYKEARRFADDALIERIQAEDKKRIDTWYSTLDKKDAGKRGDEYRWAGKNIDTGEWQTMHIPGYWPAKDGESLNGVFWFRKTIDVPERLAGQPARLNLGRIVDADTAFVNGERVGSTGYQYPPRRYNLPAGILQPGTNTIAVRVVSERKRGGFIRDKDYELLVDEHRIDLSGEWRYRMGAEMPPLKEQTFVRWKPMGLYNGMIAPLTRFAITGVIWYQGESNTSEPDEYRALFSSLIADWRAQWNRDDLPFLFVQLANFMKPAPAPRDSNWARLREAQLQTLSVPHTAMAVTIDIGEWNDIHPLNKKDVGQRLAAAANHVVYGEDIVYSGPVYDSMTVDNGRIALSFKHTGGGLVAGNGDELKEFAIAGGDRKFVRARAKIRGDNVIVWHPDIENPVAVRYAWADNPDKANLYNKAGFPASPFRTDDW